MTRTNDEWLADLRDSGDENAGAARDLTAYLRRVLPRVIGTRGGQMDLDDVVQDSLAQVLANLDRFRGDAAFLTWVTAIATRQAFMLLRRTTVRRAKVDLFASVEQEVSDLPSPAPEPADVAAHRQVLNALERAIVEDLTPRQRVAIVAELRGVPTIEIAARLGINQNALYKLVHDARKKLRRSLAAAGFAPEALHDHVEDAR